MANRFIRGRPLLASQVKLLLAYKWNMSTAGKAFHCQWYANRIQDDEFRRKYRAIRLRAQHRYLKRQKDKREQNKKDAGTIAEDSCPTG